VATADLYFCWPPTYDEPVARFSFLILLIALLVCWQPSHSQVRDPSLPKHEQGLDDRMPDGTSRSMAMVKDDQEKSLEDIALIKKAVAELEKDLSRSEFLVSLEAIENAKMIEDLAGNIQNRLKRRR
jgi:hypothetical protein